MGSGCSLDKKFKKNEQQPITFIEQKQSIVSQENNNLSELIFLYYLLIS